MIKVLERLALRIAIVVLCFMYIEWSPLILLVGVGLVYLTNVQPPQRPPVADRKLGNGFSQSTSDSAGAEQASQKAARRRSSREDEQEHESEEEFLARERYEEWCKDH